MIGEDGKGAFALGRNSWLPTQASPIDQLSLMPGTNVFAPVDRPVSSTPHPNDVVSSDERQGSE